MFENCTYEHSYELPTIYFEKVLIFCLKNIFVNPAPDLCLCDSHRGACMKNRTSHLSLRVDLVSDHSYVAFFRCP